MLGLGGKFEYFFFKYGVESGFLALFLGFCFAGEYSCFYREFRGEKEVSVRFFVFKEGLIIVGGYRLGCKGSFSRKF